MVDKSQQKILHFPVLQTKMKKENAQIFSDLTNEKRFIFKDYQMVDA